MLDVPFVAAPSAAGLALGVEGGGDDEDDEDGLRLVSIDSSESTLQPPTHVATTSAGAIQS